MSVQHVVRCRHCEVGRVNAPLGLCGGCFRSHQVRELYCGNGERYGVGLFYGPGKPTTPTDARPGTDEKIRVLEARAAASEQMWHPEDAK